MTYPICIHKDRDSEYGVTVPDLPGCYTMGSTLDEAIAMAKEAIELHLEGMVEDGEAIPEASDIQDLWKTKEYAGGTWAAVRINPDAISKKVVRINITFPERVLNIVDRFAEEQGETRSGLLVKAVTGYVKKATPPTNPRRARPRRKAKSGKQ